MLVSRLGGTMLGLGYALCGAELLLGPVMPSSTARGGGILSPIVDSLSDALGSRPDQEPERAGMYLTMVGTHANLVVSAMFLTAMAANPILAKMAKDILGVDFGWGTWALGAIVPGLICLFLLPPLMHRLTKPTLTDGRPAQDKAKEELARMGPWTLKEKTMAGVLIFLLLLWTTRPFGMGTTLIAWIGICILVLTGTEKWTDIVSNDKALDTLIWFGGLVTMATLLKEYGFIGWFAEYMEAWVSGYSGIAVAIILALVYFYSMYGFSMFTAHILAMGATFFAVILAAGAPPMLTAALFAYFSNLCGCLTNYSTGPVVMYFGLGYVPTGRWFSWGFIISFFYLAIWLGIGMVWWKILGWW
jgi:DASS family divalent anion:Na+ symporter